MSVDDEARDPQGRWTGSGVAQMYNERSSVNAKSAGSKPRPNPDTNMALRELIASSQR